MPYDDSAPMLYDCAVREMAARLLGIVATALSADSASSLLARLCDPGDRSSKFEATEGSLAATGFVLAQLSTGADLWLRVFLDALHECCMWVPSVLTLP